MPAGGTPQRAGPAPHAGTARGFHRSAAACPAREPRQQPSLRQVGLRIRPVGRRRHRHRQPRGLDQVEQLQRPRLQRNATLHPLRPMRHINRLERAQLEAFAKFGLQQVHAILARQADHRMDQRLRQMETHLRQRREHRADINRLGVQQRAVHVEQYGADGIGKGHDHGIPRQHGYGYPVLAVVVRWAFQSAGQLGQSRWLRFLTKKQAPHYSANHREIGARAACRHAP